MSTEKNFTILLTPSEYATKLSKNWPSTKRKRPGSSDLNLITKENRFREKYGDKLYSAIQNLQGPKRSVWSMHQYFKIIDFLISEKYDTYNYTMLFYYLEYLFGAFTRLVNLTTNNTDTHERIFFEEGCFYLWAHFPLPKSEDDFRDSNTMIDNKEFLTQEFAQEDYSECDCYALCRIVDTVKNELFEHNIFSFEQQQNRDLLQRRDGLKGKISHMLMKNRDWLSVRKPSLSDYSDNEVKIANSIKKTIEVIDSIEISIKGQFTSLTEMDDNDYLSMQFKQHFDHSFVIEDSDLIYDSMILKSQIKAFGQLIEHDLDEMSTVNTKRTVIRIYKILLSTRDKYRRINDNKNKIYLSDEKEGALISVSQQAILQIIRIVNECTDIPASFDM